jgi:hypothetical protein
MKRGPSFLAKRLSAWRRLHEADLARFGASDARTQASLIECARLAAGLIAGESVAS